MSRRGRRWGAMAKKILLTDSYNLKQIKSWLFPSAFDFICCLLLILALVILLGFVVVLMAIHVVWLQGCCSCCCFVGIHGLVWMVGLNLILWSDNLMQTKKLRFYLNKCFCCLRCFFFSTFNCNFDLIQDFLLYFVCLAN